MPRTTSTDSWATDANQTPYAAWGIDGKADSYNTWLQTQVGAGSGPDWLLTFDSVRDSGNRMLWASNGTANWNTGEGSHLKGTGATAALGASHEKIAVEFRTRLALLT